MRYVRVSIFQSFPFYTERSMAVPVVYSTYQTLWASVPGLVVLSEQHKSCIKRGHRGTNAI